MGLARRMGVGVQHNLLEGRTGLNCHSIDSITDLPDRLETIEDTTQSQQEDINSLKAIKTVDGGSFEDTGIIEYDGGGF